VNQSYSVGGSSDAALRCQFCRESEPLQSGLQSIGWPFPMLKFELEFIFQIKHTESILSNSTRKLLLFEITKITIAVFKK